jgi:RNA polymerase sigma-70 factor (ECF subfamily)
LDFAYTGKVTREEKIVEKKAVTTEQETDLAHPNGCKQGLREKGQDLQKRRNSLAYRLRAGRHDAAAELVDIYYEQMYLYMRRLGHGRQVSEDLTQEIFLQAWQHIGQLRNDGALNSWLYHIASNVSRLYWRRHKGKETASIEGFDVLDRSDAEARIGDFEQFERLRNAVERLPRKLREVVVLHYMQHLTICEAAEATGIREGTFKSRLNRALNSLREQIF